MARRSTIDYSASNDIRAVVANERKSLDTAFKRVSKSKESAKAFLVSAGILTKKGKLAKAYR